MRSEMRSKNGHTNGGSNKRAKSSAVKNKRRQADK